MSARRRFDDEDSRSRVAVVIATVVLTTLGVAGIATWWWRAMDQIAGALR